VIFARGLTGCCRCATDKGLGLLRAVVRVAYFASNVGEDPGAGAFGALFMWPQGINAPSTYLGRSKTPVLLPRGSASDKGNLDSRRTSQSLHGRLQTSDSLALLKFRYLTRLKQIGNDKSRYLQCVQHKKLPLSPSFSFPITSSSPPLNHVQKFWTETSAPFSCSYLVLRPDSLSH
jgi:hypothetical protein